MSDREFGLLIADIRRTTRIVRTATLVVWALVALELVAVAVWLVRS